MPRVLIANLAPCFIEEQPLQTQQRPDHVLADSLCLSLGCRPDLTVDVETCVAPAENLLDKGKADELFPDKQREDLVGEDLLDKRVMETTDTVEGTIRGCASLGHQTVNVGMKIDALSEGLDHSHHSRHELQGCGCVEKPQKCAHCAETERIEELSVKTKEKTQHFGNGKDDLSMANFKEKFFPHPLAPFLAAFSMAGRTKSACLAGKHQQSLLPTVRAPDAGKSAHRIAAVEILLNNVLDDGPEISVISHKPALKYMYALSEYTKQEG